MDDKLYKTFLEMLKADFSKSEMKPSINFYKEKLGIPRYRQLELVAISSVFVVNVGEKKFTNLYDPILKMLDKCKSKEECALLMYNFGRAIGLLFDANDGK